ncbi:TetR/AcrR family transcriptional regulator [Amycolatopsis sp. cmx-4-61]|uniref:TetR/AcrR family transcriptional regulator n=1 Tax=Amycolatopsis sp. cmx-4-61 TaxID=2790937 RepID=UPI00397B689D
MNDTRTPSAAILIAYVPILVAQFFTTAVAEEPGWRDFALPGCNAGTTPRPAPSSSARWGHVAPPAVPDSLGWLDVTWWQPIEFVVACVPIKMSWAGDAGMFSRIHPMFTACNCAAVAECEDGSADHRTGTVRGSSFDDPGSFETDVAGPFSVVRLPLRERKKWRSREALIEAALDLYGRHGFDRVTLDDLREAVEVSKRTFSAKEHVAMAPYEDLWRAFLVDLDARASHDEPGRPVFDVPRSSLLTALAALNDGKTTDRSPLPLLLPSDHGSRAGDPAAVGRLDGPGRPAASARFGRSRRGVPARRRRRGGAPAGRRCSRFVRGGISIRGDRAGIVGPGRPLHGRRPRVRGVRR